MANPLCPRPGGRVEPLTRAFSDSSSPASSAMIHHSPMRTRHRTACRPSPSSRSQRAEWLTTAFACEWVWQLWSSRQEARETKDKKKRGNKRSGGIGIGIVTRVKIGRRHLAAGAEPDRQTPPSRNGCNMVPVCQMRRGPGRRGDREDAPAPSGRVHLLSGHFWGYRLPTPVGSAQSPSSTPRH